jgi:hypothetical protein
VRILYRSIPTDLVAAQPLTTGIRRIDGELAGVTEEAVPPFRFSRMGPKGTQRQLQ